MLRVRDDDARAFEELVGRYQDRLVRILEHLGPRRDMAEDLAQEVFLRVYRARKSYEPGRSSALGCSPSPTTSPTTRVDPSFAGMR